MMYFSSWFSKGFQWVAQSTKFIYIEISIGNIAWIQSPYKPDISVFVRFYTFRGHDLTKSNVSLK